MEGSYSRVLLVFTDLLAPLVVGYFLHRRNLVGDGFVNKAIRLNVVGVFTVLSLLSFWVMPISPELVWMPFFATLYVLLPGLLGHLTFARKYRNPLDRGAYVISAMLSNLGTLGGVCAFILYREEGFAYSQMIGICQNILLVLVCFPLAQHFYSLHGLRRGGNRPVMHRGSHWRNLRDMFLSWNQVCLLGMLAGFLLNIGKVPRPESFGDIFSWLVHISAWISLMPVGFLIDFHRARAYYSRTWDLVFLRFAIVPAIIWCTSRLVFTDPVLLNTLFVCAMAPTAINAVVTTRLYKLNVDFAVASFILTTGIFLLVLFPALFFLLR